MSKEKLLISACLAGQNVRYDGKNNLTDKLELLEEKFILQYICPEVEGGMTIPRLPNEITNFSPLVVSNEFTINNKDFFLEGARIAINLTQRFKIKYALLKSNSPSCGNQQIYDGTFSNKLIDGMGITAKALYDYGVKVFNETQIDKLLGEIK